MRTPRSLLVCVLAALAGPAGTAGALETTPRVSTLNAADAFASARDALRSGVRTYNSGDKAGAVKALEFAAGQGSPLALWKLGRMYADGDGVPRDDLKAFEYFSRIADENADESPGSDRSGIVASAFVALGSYFLDGIVNTYVRSSPERAVEMFHYAAAYFGDSNAQYNLARLYLDGTGTARDPRQAARWFNLAAEKGHHPAQALLGQMLLAGQSGVPRERARGLMWLTLAKNGADPKGEAWIGTLYDDAIGGTSEADRKLASAFVEQYQIRRR